jgi:hypothetical protein
MGNAAFEGDEEWDLSALPIPARSTLYALEPMGMGTALGESLSSYITRLAAAHCIFPGVLMNKVVEPLVQGKNVRLVHLSHGEKTNVLNGTGLRATLTVECFEALTQRRDLRHLTLLSWTEVLFIRGLIHGTKVWCPRCYEEWREMGQIVYDPLLWVLQPVTTCVRHRIALSQRCPYQDCGRRLPALCWRSYPGYCAYCQRWLGTSPGAALKTSITETEHVWQQWVTEQIGALVALSPRISVSPSKKHVAETLTFLLQQIFGGRSAALAHTLKLPRPIVNHWFHGRFPQIDMLLHMCYVLGLSLDAFLLQDATMLHPCVREVHEHLLNGKRVKIGNIIQESQNMQHALEDILAGNTYPPPSLAKVAMQLGHDVHVLSRWHPALCQAICIRHKEYTQQRTAARMQKHREELREAALKLHAKGLSLTRGRISRLLPQPGILRNPQLRQLLAEVSREVEQEKREGLSQGQAQNPKN